MTDWPTLLRAHGIEFVESGPSTARGNIYTRCFICGADGGFHLGIHLGRGRAWRGWGCWKNASHRGRSARRLLGGLLGIGLSQAQALLDARGGASIAPDDEIGRRVADMRGQGLLDEPGAGEPLAFPDEIKLIQTTGQGRLFLSYLDERGWLPADAARVCFRYKLRYAMRGAFSYRLVVPIYSESGDRDKLRYDLVTWTGRTISPDVEPRYKTLSTDPEKATEDETPLARAKISDCLFGEDQLFTQMGRGLVVCEGPLDAIRVDYAGHRLGVRGTCLFGKALSDVQVDKLHAIAPYYGTKLLLLDRDATMDAYRMVERLGPSGFRAARLPRRYKDPGEMSLTAIEDFLEREIK